MPRLAKDTFLDFKEYEIRSNQLSYKAMVFKQFSSILLGFGTLTSNSKDEKWAMGHKGWNICIQGPWQLAGQS